MSWTKSLTVQTLRAILVMGLLVSSGQVFAQANLQDRDQWVTRMRDSATQVLSGLEKTDPSYEAIIRDTSRCMVLAGQEEEAWMWIEKHEPTNTEHFRLVAGWLASMGKVNDALTLAEQMDGLEQQMTFCTIIAAQSQRGEFPGAIRLLWKLADTPPEAKNLAIHSICTAYAREGKFEEAEKLLPTITQEGIRRSTQSIINLRRKWRKPDEDGYVEFRTELAKSSLPQTAGVMRFVALAEAALAKGDKQLATRHLQKAAEQVRRVDPILVVTPTIAIGTVAESAGMTDLAKQAFQHAIDKHVSSGQFLWEGFQENRSLRNEAFEAFARAMPTEVVERLVQRSQNQPASQSLAANLIAVLVQQGALEKASAFYSGQPSPELKYQICKEVLEHAYSLQADLGDDFGLEIPVMSLLGK